MMKPEIKEQKIIFLQSYSEFKQIENLVHTINKSDTSLQVAILGKVTQQDLNNSTVAMELRCNTLFEPISNFGIISNPEIGDFFVAGAFATMFLQEVNGKKIGAMSMGPYSILRGLGVHQDSVNHHLKKLISGSYILILRGSEDELKPFLD
ncbi:hypothetical protein ES677_11490 [Bizionia gelidisalsuginis]|uniref:Uncharacterized protein n=1 Tax=Bizionia gelidisalsuginis TaxID=291188 RepID=A0ABY3M8K7_9FLAO|nr:hypothetical protein [Bizionia gelidisalsuginis]TYC10557.1 hypothetical protein ES677_11490 [Bizionia gelidisalsuginis]